MTRYYCKGTFSAALLEALEDRGASATDHEALVLVETDNLAEEVYDLLVGAGVEISIVEDI